MKIGSLVKRNPDIDEYMYLHELEEIGIVIGKELGVLCDAYIIVLWGNIGLSWDSPEDLLEIL
jgi:hypothetical protein